MRAAFTLCTLSSIIGFAGVAAAQSTVAVASNTHAEAPRAHAVRLAGHVAIDGRLDDAAWRAAPVVDRFTQRDPTEGAPVSERTEVRVVYDDHAIYIGAVLFDRSPVSARLGRRDAEMDDADWFSVAFDSYHDHLTAYRFEANPAGVRRDEVLTGGDDDEGDASWDPVWELQTSVSELGWTAEMRIPFSQLRFDPRAVGTWGVQFARRIARRGEVAYFAFTSKEDRAGIARFGHIEGLEGIRQGRGLEMLPYATLRAEYQRIPNDDDAAFKSPFRDGSDFFSNTGIDLKYRVRSNLTLDATVNPDFGQVELDPAVVNLSAFETSFSERRPFFVEGTEVFDFGSGRADLLYSRRIGRRPTGDVPERAIYTDMPEASRILGAAKMVGRTASGWSLGLLDAVTARESARWIDENRAFGRTEVAPLSNFFVGRARRSMHDGRTVAGGMLTLVNRDLRDDSLASVLRSSAVTGGFDLHRAWADQSWSMNAFAVASRIVGAPDVMIATQQSSARYYQRPDASHLAVDSSAASLFGYSGGVEIEKQAGLHWRGGTELLVTSPGFEINDLGFQSDADRSHLSGDVRYVENRPGKLLRSWSAQINPEARWNFAGERLGGEVSLELDAELKSFWQGELSVQRGVTGFDDRLTRGGPLTARPVGRRVFASIESDPRRSWTMDLGADYAEDEAGGRSSSLEVEFAYRRSAWSLSLSPELNRERDAAQYLATEDDALATATYGRRFVFAPLRQTELALPTRLNVTWRPGLTLELYVRPFVSSGTFGRPKELAAPRTFSFREYGVDIGTANRDSSGNWLVDPDGPGPAESFDVESEDFSEPSLRGNAVLRWEWRPGSTLFVVWQQQRSAASTRGAFDIGRDARGLWRARPANVFAVKVSYWIAP